MLPIFLGVAIIVILAVWAFYKVPAINKLFRDSETVALQAVKAAFGAIATLLTLVDRDQVETATQTVVTQLGLAQWWPVYALGLGVLMIAVNRFRQEA